MGGSSGSSEITVVVTLLRVFPRSINNNKNRKK